MKQGRFLMTIVGIAGLLCLQIPQAWGAKTSVAGGTPSCMVSNPGNGAIAIRGTVSAEVTSGADNPFGSQDVDFTLRLERSGVLQFFRLHLFTPVLKMSNEEIVCRILDSNANPDVAPFAQAVLQAFGISTSRIIVITDSSIKNAESLDADKSIPGTAHGSSMADVIIYAK